MKKLALALSILFTILTLIGSVYVLYNKGQVSAGYSVVPMIFAVTCLSLYRKKTNL